MGLTLVPSQLSTNETVCRLSTASILQSETQIFYVWSLKCSCFPGYRACQYSDDTIERGAKTEIRFPSGSNQITMLIGLLLPEVSELPRFQLKSEQFVELMVIITEVLRGSRVWSDARSSYLHPHL